MSNPSPTPTTPPTPAAPAEARGWTTWLKPIAGALAGLFSGAAMMYLSPLLDKVFKPSKPVANFAADPGGMTVSFHNRSLSFHSGWWDFGDGSPLELVDEDQEMVSHTYANPGDYTVKLIVRNVLGEPDERTVTLHLNGHHGEPPQIASLDAIPMSPGSIAPATFRVVSKVMNAKVCVWDLDDDRPLEIVNDCAGGLDRLVTFEKPGGYVIKLAAVNGNHAVEKTEIVNVMERQNGMVSAVLTVADQATKVETVMTPFTFVEQFPTQFKQDVYKFEKQAPARQGFEIIDIRLQKGNTPGPRLEGKSELSVDSPFLTGMGMRNVKLRLEPDRKTVKLSGELARDPIRGKKDATQPKITVPIVLIQEQRSQAQRTPTMVTASFKVPGIVVLKLPELPKEWIAARRQFRLEIRDDEERVIVQESLLPRNKRLTIQGKRYILNAEQKGDNVQVDLTAEKALSPVGN